MRIEKLTVRPGFHDLAVTHDNNPIRPANSGQSMRHNEGGSARHETFQGLLDESFGFVIQRGGCFIKDEDTRVTDEGSGNSEALALTTREASTTFPNDGVEAPHLQSRTPQHSRIVKRPTPAHH